MLCTENANAQLWSYIGITDAKIKAFDKYLKKEAYKVIPRHTDDVDKSPYDEMIYRLQGLDSTTYYVHVSQVPFEKKLNITMPTDSLRIQDCMGPARLHLLRKNLFEIVYSPRGGSDDGFDNVLLLAIRDGKFRIAMEIQTMHDYDGPGFFGLNETHLYLTGETPGEYQLTLKNHDLRRYDKKTKNYDHYLTQNLKYDSKRNLFYTSNEKIEAWRFDDEGNMDKTATEGIFPVINFGGDKYCFVDDSWYAVSQEYGSKKTVLEGYCYRPKTKN